MRVSKDEARMGAWVYILKCADGSYYTGTTRADLDRRVGEHQQGLHDGYTATRLPVALAYSEYFERIVDAIAAERQIKGWSRAKKRALVSGNFEQLKVVLRRRQPYGPHPSRRAPLARSSG